MRRKDVITGLDYYKMEDAYEENGISKERASEIESMMDRFALEAKGDDVSIPFYKIVRLRLTDAEIYYAINYCYMHDYNIHSYININCSLSNFVYLRRYGNNKLPKAYSEVKQNILIKKLAALRFKVIRKISRLKPDVNSDDISEFISPSFLDIVSQLSSDLEFNNLYSEYIDVRNDLLIHNLRAANLVARSKIELFENSDSINYFMHYYTLEAIEKYMAKYYPVSSDNMEDKEELPFKSFLFSYLRFMALRQSYDREEIISKPRHCRVNYNKINKLIQEGESLENVSKILNISLEDVEDLLRIFEPVQSLEEVGADNLPLVSYVSGKRFKQFEKAIYLPTYEEDEPLSLCMNEELHYRLLACLDGLDDFEKQVIMMRYGLTDGRNRTLKEIGDYFGVTREYIRQIEKKALIILRNSMHEYDYLEYSGGTFKK